MDRIASPDFKISRRPKVQATVDAKFQKLQNQFPDVKNGELNRFARNDTAKEIRIERLRGENKYLEAIAMTDRLTGLYSREWMEEELGMKTAEADRKGKTFKVLFIDFDHFKWINDGYGHSVGDKVLETARVLSKRKEEPMARWGGEEFIQIIPNGEDENALSILVTRYMETIEIISRKILNETPYKKNANPEHKLSHETISIGIAEYTPGMGKEKLLELVDSALYKAKEERNCAVYAKKNESDTIGFTKLQRRK